MSSEEDSCSSNANLKIVAIDAESEGRQPVTDNIVRQMYRLLGANMTAVIKSSLLDWKTREAFENWRSEVFHKGLREGTRHILLFDDTGLRGFISYTAPIGGAEIYWNEFQIHPDAQADGVTFKRLLFCFMERIRNLPHDSIRTYTNKANERAQRLIEKMGFQRQEQTERGIRYTVTREILQERFRDWGEGA